MGLWILLWNPWSRLDGTGEYSTMEFPYRDSSLGGCVASQVSGTMQQALYRTAWILRSMLTGIRSSTRSSRSYGEHTAFFFFTLSFFPVPMSSYLPPLRKNNCICFWLRSSTSTSSIMALSFVYDVAGLLLLLPLAWLAAQFLYQIVYYRFFHPLATFPGPFWGSVTRLWITWHNIKGDEPWVFRALHEKYGEFLGGGGCCYKGPSKIYCMNNIPLSHETRVTKRQAPSSASRRPCCSSTTPQSSPTSTAGAPTSRGTTSRAASARPSRCSTCRTTGSTPTFARLRPARVSFFGVFFFAVYLHPHHT